MEQYIKEQTKMPNTTYNNNTECYMCLEDFYEFGENYFQCGCGERTCLSCINYKIKNNKFKCLCCKNVWDKEYIDKHTVNIND